MPVIRTCLGCRGQDEKSDLLRVVAGEGPGGQLVVDRAQRRPGRGGYLHPDADCLRLAIKRRAFARALRRPGLDPTGSLAELERAVDAHRLV